MGYVSKECRPIVYSKSSLDYDRQAVTLYENTLLSTTPKSLSVKNLEFNAIGGSGLTLGTVQAPVAKASELDVLTFSTTENLSQQDSFRR